MERPGLAALGSSGTASLRHAATFHFYTTTCKKAGTLSLENNGGFASVRTKPTELDIKAGDTIVVRAKGDGREYAINLYTKSRRMAFSYRAQLPTTKAEWTEVRVPLEDFISTAFGRRVHGMEPVEPDQINGLGFMLSDEKPGKFRLQVERVKVERGAR